ncbi:hypothetical protein AFK68_21125 [Hydrocoleum sp. CS-953]|nr:hypothetical protein AFK68_21125 [Hydrocoleum sp. CS-953]
MYFFLNTEIAKKLRYKASPFMEKKAVKNYFLYFFLNTEIAKKLRYKASPFMEKKAVVSAKSRHEKRSFP